MEIGLRLSIDELALLCAVLDEHVRGRADGVGEGLLRRLEGARGRPRRGRAKGHRATVLRVDGTRSIAEFPGEPPLEWLQREVGGYVQLVALGGARVACNEDAELIGLPVNSLAATVLGHVTGTRDGMLRGDVVLLEREQ
jgi:Domain of unknown function (DUF3846)